MSTAYAHTSPVSSRKEDWEPLDSHLELVAQLAKQFATPLQLGELAYLAGLLHDLGKNSVAFQQYLQDAAEGKEPLARVNHAWAGAQYLLKQTASCTPHEKLSVIALIYAISGHHSGLTNGNINHPGREASTIDRKILDEVLEPYMPTELIEQYMKQGTITKAISELPNVLKSKLPQLPTTADQRVHVMFEITMIIRMLYSCLVDADFLATESMMNPEQSAQRPTQDSALMLHKMHQRFEERLIEFTKDASHTPLNHWRSYISNRCFQAAAQEPGVFTLTVPTGGGKTLASLRFALKHAQEHQKTRIIYVIPYTSIIEQTAETFRQFLGDEHAEHILEHHSNIPISIHANECDTKEKQARLRTENWDAPLIVTTAVQFFESLFAAKSSKNRKLHRMAQSVIIIDEAQLMPLPLMKACLFALNSLTQFGSSLVLCTATQPPLNYSPELTFGIRGAREIMTFDSEKDREEYQQTFQRVKVSWIRDSDKPVELSDLAQELSRHSQFLCIINHKKFVRQLFQEIQDLLPEAESDSIYHLSTSMCAAHRSDVLTTIRQRLAEGKACRVISTSLIEAGVDVDFPLVFKDVDGLDSVAQAAGRCNREGRLKEQGRTYLFSLANYRPPVGNLRSARDTTLKVISNHSTCDNFIAPEMIDDYFTSYYARQKELMDPKAILVENSYSGDYSSCLPSHPGIAHSIQFSDMDDRFQMIEQLSEPILIPWNAQSRHLLEQLRETYQPSLQRQIWRALQPYIVTVRPPEQYYLQQQGVLETIHDNFLVLYPEFVQGDLSFYHPSYGLKTSDDPQDAHSQSFYI